MDSKYKLQPKKSKPLKKHVAAIHSGSKLTLVQRKIANGLLYNAYDKLLKEDEHTIHIEDLCELIGYNSKDYNLVRNALKALLSTVIEWNLVDNGSTETEEIWNASSIISDASTNGPICTYSYSNRMKQLLYHPEVYGRIDMAVLGSFKSTYGLALFENCSRYQDVKQTPWLDLSIFRKLMGIEEGRYPIFRDFKRRVIDKAVLEVNSLTSLNVSFETKRVNRSVSQVKFKIEKKESTHPEIQATSLSNLLIADFGLDTKQVEHISSNYKEHYIQEKIQIVRASGSYKEGRIKNLAKYLLNALEKDFKSPRSSKEVLEKKKKQDHEGKTEYAKYCRKHFIEGFKSLAGKEKRDIVNGFEKYISQGIYHNIFLKDGIGNPLVEDQLVKFLKGTKNILSGSLKSYDDFLRVEA